MDIISLFANLASGFGLSASAGLNAYIPLLIVALTARFTSWFDLGEPYNLLASLPVIGILTVLLIVEMFADKIPAVDTVNDMIQTLVRPTAGAVLFAANNDILSDIHPLVAAAAGLALAGSVHGVKTVVRPAVTATTAGTGNWFVSLVEDIIAFFVSILAIFAPFFVAIFGLFAFIFGFRWWRKRKLAAAGGW